MANRIERLEVAVENELDLTNTGVFAAIGTPHLPPGPLMVAEAAASAQMLEQDRMTAADVLVLVKAKWPNALQSPVAQACQAATDSLLNDAVEHAEKCLDATDGWGVETLGHNIESSFPELEPEQCDDIAAAVLKTRRRG
jgi:hypothetical protein